MTYDEAVKRWARRWVEDVQTAPRRFWGWPTPEEAVDVNWDQPVELRFDYEGEWHTECTGGGGTAEIVVSMWVRGRKRDFVYADMTDQTTALPDLIREILAAAA